jgi:hypothetical protein
MDVLLMLGLASLIASVIHELWSAWEGRNGERKAGKRGSAGEDDRRYTAGW